MLTEENEKTSRVNSIILACRASKVTIYVFRNSSTVEQIR